MNSQAAGRRAAHALQQGRLERRCDSLALRIAQIPAVRCLHPCQDTGDGDVVPLAWQLAQRRRGATTCLGGLSAIF